MDDSHIQFQSMSLDVARALDLTDPASWAGCLFEKSVIGLYFLVEDNELVYIGKSDNIMNRILTHRREGRKKFDSFFIIPVELSCDLPELEAEFIDRYKPKYNVHIPPGPQYKTPREIALILHTEEKEVWRVVLEHDPPKRKNHYHLPTVKSLLMSPSLVDQIYGARNV